MFHKIMDFTSRRRMKLIIDNIICSTENYDWLIAVSGILISYSTLA